MIAIVYINKITKFIRISSKLFWIPVRKNIYFNSDIGDSPSSSQNFTFSYARLSFNFCENLLSPHIFIVENQLFSKLNASGMIYFLSFNLNIIVIFLKCKHVLLTYYLFFTPPCQLCTHADSSERWMLICKKLV